MLPTELFFIEDEVQLLMGSLFRFRGSGGTDMLMAEEHRIPCEGSHCPDKQVGMLVGKNCGGRGLPSN
jgi:hypothetical protein